MAFISQEEFFDGKKDAHWKNKYENACKGLKKKLNSRKKDIANIYLSGLPVTEAEKIAESIFNENFKDDVNAITGYRRLAHEDLQGKSGALGNLQAKQNAKENLENNNGYLVTGKETIEMPKFEFFKMLGYFIISVFLFFMGVNAAAIFLQQSAGFKEKVFESYALVIPCLFALAALLHLLLDKLSESDFPKKATESLHYIFIIVGIIASVNWIINYGEFASSASTIKFQTRSATAPSSATDESQNKKLMIIFTMLAECIAAGVAFQHALDSRKKFKRNDQIALSAAGTHVDKEILTAANEVSRLESRILLADALITMLEAAEKNLKIESKQIYYSASRPPLSKKSPP